MTRPLTTRDARRAYLDATRAPRVSKAEESRREREELERIREEDRQGRERARARAARERKRAREEEERAEKRRRGSRLDVKEEREGVDSRDDNQRNAQCGEAQACAEPDGQELDDLFLSASQLDREVGGTSQTPRKRSRDEAFRRPDPPPPKPPDRASPCPPVDPGLEEPYDLGVSSQELLQLEARETRRACVPGEGRHSARGSPGGSSKGMPDGLGAPTEPAEPDISFAESFDLSSQDLRELDALGPLPTEHSTLDPPRNPGPDKSPNMNQVEPDARGPATWQDTLVGEESRPSPTSGKGPVSRAEVRSRSTQVEGPQRGTDICPSPGKPRDTEPKGNGPSRATTGRRHGVAKRGTCSRREDGGEVAQVRADTPRQPKDSGTKARAAKPGPGSPDLDDDAWWEDLDNTDLAALLECPA